jgi:hypothetical protein
MKLEDEMEVEELKSRVKTMLDEWLLLTQASELPSDLQIVMNRVNENAYSKESLRKIRDRLDAPLHSAHKKYEQNQIVNIKYMEEKGRLLKMPPPSTLAERIEARRRQESLNSLRSSYLQEIHSSPPPTIVSPPTPLIVSPPPNHDGD